MLIQLLTCHTKLMRGCGLVCLRVVRGKISRVQKRGGHDLVEREGLRGVCEGYFGGDVKLSESIVESKRDGNEKETVLIMDTVLLCRVRSLGKGSAILPPLYGVVPRLHEQVGVKGRVTGDVRLHFESALHLKEMGRNNFFYWGSLWSCD